MIQYFSTDSYPMHFGLCTSPKAFAKEMKRLGVKDAGAFNDSSMNTHYFECHTTTPSLTVLVCANKKDIKSKPLGSLLALFAHEAVHVWQEVKSAMRENNPGREMEAYAIHYFSLCLFNAALRIRGEKQ